jgi:SSS family solute:Na+ symporter
VFTDATQSVVMILGALTLWGTVWWKSGGWEGLTAKLDAIDPALTQTLLHTGGYSPTGVPPLLVIFGFCIGLTTYAVINQYEAIRFLGARSEWDFKMAVVVAATATAICLWFNVSLGPFARAEFAGLETVDQAYPLLVKKYLPPGLVGLVVAGLIAAGYSTFDSVGIGISSLFVRDIYARYFVKNASDAHYTRVGRISVPFIFALGFAYLPFIQEGMLMFFLRLAGAIGVPLMSVMLMGVFTRVHRRTGSIGLAVGLSYGMLAVCADFGGWGLPTWMINTWWTYLWNVVLPPLSMIVASKIIDRISGPVGQDELKGLVYARHERTGEIRELMSQRLKVLDGTWLQKTLAAVPERPEYPFPLPESGLPWFKRPALWAGVYLAIASFLFFVVLW